ncbi:unnamed protein product, partial [Brassica rapa subsp. trilocularis]
EQFFTISPVLSCTTYKNRYQRYETFADKQSKEEDQETGADRLSRRNKRLRISTKSQRTSNESDHQRLHVSFAHASLPRLHLLILMFCIFLFSLLLFFLCLSSLPHHFLGFF